MTLYHPVSTNSQFWIIGLILSLVGVLLLFISWFDARILLSSVSYDALDMAFSKPFQAGGFWENFDPLGKYCPLIFGILSVVNCVLFYLAKDGSYHKAIIVISFVMIALAIYVILCINPMSSSAGSRSPGASVYLGIAVGVGAALVGYFGNKGSFHFVYEKNESDVPKPEVRKPVKNKWGPITIEFLEAPASVGNVSYYTVDINGMREGKKILPLQKVTFRLFSGKNVICIEIHGDAGTVTKEFYPVIELGDRYKILNQDESFNLVLMRRVE